MSYEKEQPPPWCPLKKTRAQPKEQMKGVMSRDQSDDQKNRLPKPWRAPPCPNGFLYTVRRGDTISRLALRYDLTLQDLLTANPDVMNPNRLRVGEKVCIPLPIPEVNCPVGVLHMIRKGENLVSIAERYNLTLEELLKANPQIRNPNIFFPGQMVCIPEG